jgi:hypothetical protein
MTSSPLGKSVTYLAIDPGTQMGWARSDAGRITGCGMAHVFNDTPCVGVPPCQNGVVVIEEPVFRQGGQNKVDPNDLIALGIKVGRVTEVYLVLGNKVETVTPSSWKGSTPKHIQEERTEAALDDAERAMVLETLLGVPRTYQHNVWDALGILVWKLKKENLR